MFDTVNYWIPSSRYNESDVLESLSNNSITLRDMYVETSEIGSTIYKGKIKNYDMKINERGIALNGSIAKYIYGDNTLEFANRLSYENGVENLFGIIGIDSMNANITRLDIGQNLKMDSPVFNYHSLLATLPRLTRFVYLNSLYFKNKRKELIFYDKEAERRERGYGKVSSNLLRYELRLLKNPSSFLGVGKLNANTLVDKSVCKKLLQFWFNEYKRIQKNSLCTPRLYFRTPADLKNVLASYAVSDNTLDIFNEIEKNIKNGSITTTNAHRCKILIADLQRSVTKKTGESFLVNELNTKMEDKYKQCLKSMGPIKR